MSDRRESESYAVVALILGLFHLKGHLHDRFKGMLYNTHNIRVKSVVHGNLKAFAESVWVVCRRGAANLHPLLQAITETWNRIMRNSSESCK